MGPRSVILEDLGAPPAAWAGGLRRLALTGVVDVVPAAATVLVSCTDEHALRAVRERLDEVRAVDLDSPGAAPIVEIAVRYDGDDLLDVSGRTGLTPDEVIAAHSASTYVVAFCGFAPGFAYLRGLDDRLRLPRRSTPRTRVPAGSVAIADEYAAVYPRPTPGGWHLLGTTDAVMFDPDRHRPALLEPGLHVRFVPQ
jgi:KipI family sensor histidine kinase inhibitor